MKRFFCLLLAMLTVLLCACGGSPAQSGTSSAPAASSSTQSTPSTPAPAPSKPDSSAPAGSGTTETPAPAVPYDGPVNPLTGLPTEMDLSSRKPVAIMLNNAKGAQPQQGNSQADIIYEVLAEGNITRMLGVYQDISDLGVVGSVRSARLYYLELALGHDAVFVHAGGSGEFYEKAKAWGLSTVDGVNGHYSQASTGLYWRDKNRVAGKNYAYEHSMVTSGERLTSILTKDGLLSEHTDGYSYGMAFTADGTPTGGQSAVTITVPFFDKNTTFRYDAAAGIYNVEQHGGAYIDGNNGTQISATNVLVLQTDCTVMDNVGRLRVDLSSGSGWFACGGKYIPITWEKGERDQQLRYFTADGQPLTVGQGKSYVCIIPENRELKAE